MNYTQTFFSRQFIWEIVRILTVGMASLLFFLNVGSSTVNRVEVIGNEFNQNQ